MHVKDTEEYITDYAVNGENLAINWAENPPSEEDSEDDDDADMYFISRRLKEMDFIIPFKTWTL
jgi:hypothetical protein